MINKLFLSTLIASMSFAMIVVAPQTCFAIEANDVNKDEGIINQTPAELKDIGYEERLGTTISSDHHFKDENGNDVTLGKYFATGKPVILSLAYYNCPGLCNFHLNGMTEALKETKLKMGKDYEYVVVSFDSREKPALAKQKKENYLRSLGDSTRAAAEGWHFLTGDDQNIAALTKEVGFKFRWDKEANEFAHASAALLLTPDGKISRYLPGIHFEPKTVQLGLVEASNGTVGTLVDRFILYCFHYDPKQSKYVVAAMRVMRIAGALTVLILALFIAPYWWRQRRDPNGARLQGEVL